MKKKLAITLILVAVLLIVVFILVKCTKVNEPESPEASSTNQVTETPEEPSKTPEASVSSPEQSEEPVLDPPTPEEISAEIRNYVPTTLDFDQADYPLLKTPPTLDQILGDHSQTFSFDEEEWTFTENIPTGKRYTDADGNKLLLGNDGSANISNCNSITDAPDAFLIGYDPDGKVNYFNSNDSFYEEYISHDMDSDEILNGINSMIREGSIRYYYNCQEDGTLVSVRIVIEEKLNGETITREFLYDAASDSIVESSMILDREDGVPNGYTASYLPDGTLHSVYYTYGTENDLGQVIYTFDGQYKLTEQDLPVTNG